MRRCCGAYASDVLANPARLPMSARAAVAETMVQMECDYVTPSFFRELEKEYQSGLRRCGAGCWCRCLLGAAAGCWLVQANVQACAVS